MQKITVERALEISKMERGTGVVIPASNIILLAVESLIEAGEKEHAEAIEKLRVLANVTKKKKPEAVASTKAPKRPRAPKKAPAKAEEPKEEAQEEKKPKEEKKRGNEHFLAHKSLERLTAFHPTKMDHVTEALEENPYRVFLIMEEEDEKQNPILTIFRVLYFSKKQNKLVLFDETTQAGETLTSKPGDFLMSKHLFRDSHTKEDFHIQFAIQPK